MISSMFLRQYRNVGLVIKYLYGIPTFLYNPSNRLNYKKGEDYDR